MLDFRPNSIVLSLIIKYLAFKDADYVMPSPLLIVRDFHHPSVNLSTSVVPHELDEPSPPFMTSTSHNGN